MIKSPVKVILIIMAIVLPLVWDLFIDDYIQEREERRQIMSEYRGVIIVKDDHHVNKLKIKTPAGTETIFRPTMQLYENASIGDSLIKIGGEDSVILIKKDSVRRKFMYD